MSLTLHAQAPSGWRAAAPAAALALAGCSPVYVFKSCAGHMRLMSGRRAIEKALADPKVLPEVKVRLRLVGEIRAFAFDRVGLPRSRSYTHYVDVGRPYVTMAVTASHKTALKPVTWWFPIAGRVPYKGYFNGKDAEAEAARLERKGFDTWLMPARAYSTLGWLSDPVLSTMIEDSPAALADTIIHELAHAAVYLKGQADFNESAASFIGEAGAREFIVSRFGEGSAEARSLEATAARIEEGSRALEELAKELEALYGETLPDEEKLRRREGVFERFRPRLRVGPEVRVNNAWVLGHRRYRMDLGDFRAAHERVGRRWPETLKLLRSLDRRRPRESLKEWLSKSPAPR